MAPWSGLIVAEGDIFRNNYCWISWVLTLWSDIRMCTSTNGAWFNSDIDKIKVFILSTMDLIECGMTIKICSHHGNMYIYNTMILQEYVSQHRTILAGPDAYPQLHVEDMDSTDTCFICNQCIYLCGRVDQGPCLEEYLHHTGITLGRCQHQSSHSILWKSGG